MLSKTMIALSLIMATSVSAEIVQETPQQSTFSGAAGNTSLEPGINAFTFQKFDDTLGTLLNVFFKTTFIVSGGLIGADNMTNDTTSGFGDLGAKVTLIGSEPLLNSNYASLFAPIELTQRANFNLAADPTLSTGGTGPDVATYYGQTLQEDIGPWRAVSKNFLANYTGANQTFSIDFDTDPTVLVSVPGAQGFFQVPNFYLSVEVSYEYEAYQTEAPTTTDVNSPGGAAMAGLGLSLMLLSASRKQKSKSS